MVGFFGASGCNWFVFVVVVVVEGDDGGVVVVAVVLTAFVGVLRETFETLY